jgi:hypothetical protein
MGVEVFVDQLHEGQRHPGLLGDLVGVAAVAQHQRGRAHPVAGPFVLVWSAGDG